MHWHPSRLCSRGYCAAADEFCWRHVLLSPHTKQQIWCFGAALEQLQKTQKAQCFWTLSTLLLMCYSASLLLLSQSGAAQKHQMSIPEAHVCRPSVQQAHCTCICSNNPETQAIQGQKIHQVFQSHPRHELEQSEDGSVCINWVSPKEGHVLPMSYVSGLAVRLGDKETWDCLGTACLTWL